MAAFAAAAPSLKVRAAAALTNIRVDSRA